MRHAATAPDAPARAVAAFRKAFGRDPALLATAPGRVNLIGEHIDYSGGHVLPFAIDRVCAVALAPAASAESRILAADLGEWFEFPCGSNLAALRDCGAIARGSWQSYIAGAIHFTAEAVGEQRAIDVAVATDVPIGAGLSSSAALEAAVATALEALSPAGLDPLEKAGLCQRAEHEFAGVPCGLMDQAAACLSRAGHALLLDCRNPEAFRHIPLPPRDQAAFIVIDTRVKHSLAAGEYAQRRTVSETAARKLGLKHLCDGNARLLDHREDSTILVRGREHLTDEEERCARHAVTENQRVLDAAHALQRGDLFAMGRLLLESHESLRNHYRVSCDELDFVVDTAASHPGVFGARMTGGGFGGCAILVAEPDSVRAVQDDISRAFQGRFSHACAACLVTAGPGATVVKYPVA